MVILIEVDRHHLARRDAAQLVRVAHGPLARHHLCINQGTVDQHKQLLPTRIKELLAQPRLDCAAAVLKRRRRPSRMDGVWRRQGLKALAQRGLDDVLGLVDPQLGCVALAGDDGRAAPRGCAALDGKVDALRAARRGGAHWLSICWLVCDKQRASLDASLIARAGR